MKKVVILLSLVVAGGFGTGCSDGARSPDSGAEGGASGAVATGGNQAGGAAGTTGPGAQSGGAGGMGGGGAAGSASVGGNGGLSDTGGAAGADVDAGVDGPVAGAGGMAGTAGAPAGAGGAAAGTSGGAGAGGAGGPAGAGGSMPVGAPPCSDLFPQTLQTFAIDISADDWTALQTEFMTAGMLPDDMFVQYSPAYYPVVFHYGTEAVADAYIRLKGDSSWREAVAYDGPNGKMQFVIAFDHVNSKATFHGVGKIGFDMPRTDPTFMRERIGNLWLRSVGIPSVCATNAALVVNGSLYGLFVAEQHISHDFVKEWFPANSGGDLFKGGWTPETNKSNPNWTRLDQFWAAMTPADLTAIVDVSPSLLSWAAEAMANDADGYYGGDHNFYLYDEGPTQGYVFFPTDLDSSLDYLGQFTADPIYWWSTRHNITAVPQHYRIVMGDDNLRAQYIAAVSTQLRHWNVPQLQSWIDTAAAQIQQVVDADPHKPATTTVASFQSAVALARTGIQARADYVSSWLDCRASGTGADQDGDGVIWCLDCRDDDPTIHPGAAEICGNGIDENCNGLFDEGCP